MKCNYSPNIRNLPRQEGVVSRFYKAQLLAHKAAGSSPLLLHCSVYLVLVERKVSHI